MSLDGSGIVTVDGGRQPRKVSDFVQGAKGVFRITMAIQTKCHTQMFSVRNFLHLVDSPMAIYATDAAIDVDGVIEVSIIRHFMNTSPWYWWTLAENAVVIDVFPFA